jgi:hypothetical protein
MGANLKKWDWSKRYASKPSLQWEFHPYSFKGYIAGIFEPNKPGVLGDVDLNRCRLGDLSPTYKWSDLQLNQWINDAIADYSLHFPRLLELKIDCTAGGHSYQLPADARAILAVEYPEGQDPPAYLTPGDRFSAGFYTSAALYDYNLSNDQDNPGYLYPNKTFRIVQINPITIPTGILATSHFSINTIIEPIGRSTSRIATLRCSLTLNVANSARFLEIVFSCSIILPSKMFWLLISSNSLT